MMAKKKEERKTKSKANGLGTVWERKNSKWSWQITLGYDQDGKRIARAGTEKDKTTASKSIAAAITAHEKGLLAPPDKTTLNEYAQTWLERQTNLATNTRISYQRELGAALKYIGTLKPREVRAAHIRDTLAQLAVTPTESGMGAGRMISSRTLAHIRTRLRAVFREAIADGLIAINPTEAVKRVKVSRTEHPGIALDFDQVARLHELGETLYTIGVCRLWPALFTCVSIGLRRGEVMGLRWCDLDLEHDLLRVQQNLTTPGGKLEMRPTKTVSGTREVLIPASLKAVLERQRKSQLAELDANGIAFREDTPVFATTLGTYTHPDNLDRSLKGLLEWSTTEPITRKRDSGERDAKGEKIWVEYQVAFKDRLKAIAWVHRAKLELVIRSGEILPNTSPHDLRHTAGTLMLRRGMPIEVVSKVLGHSKVSTTLDIYRHVLESERREHVIDLFETPLPKRVADVVVMN
jgi:integrase